MKRKWIVMPSLLVLMVIAVLAVRPTPDVVVDRAMQAKLIDALVAKLNDHYVFPDKARKIGAVLRQRQQAGSYDGIKDGYRLAGRLTADMHGVAKDLHMKVWFAPGLALSGEADEPEPASQAEWEQRNNVVTRLVMRHTETRGVLRTGRLGHDIGYLKISAFPAAYLVAGKFAAAMNELADTSGLIVDLRRNVGGEPQSVALLISYFVDRRTRLNDIWDRDTGNTVQHWTEDELEGKRYGGRKPVLLLVGPDTASAGEDFAYTMQALKRATVIGERTWGGAHPASLYHIGEHFHAVIPNQRSISPITGTNWEGVGVTPDIAMEPAQALAVAGRLMRQRLRASAALVAGAY